MNAPAIEQLLADLRAWLETQPAASAPVPAEPVIDLAAIIAPFVALRHEVNLQTKASRAQFEQNAQTLEHLRQALDVLRRPPPAAPATDDVLRPLLKTLIDVYDALALGRREAQRLRDSIPEVPAPEALLPPEPIVRLPWWARWLGLQARVDRASIPWHQQLTDAIEQIRRMRQKVDALFSGYDMSVQRVQRALEQNGLERIACAGQPFDPETMEVAEVVRDPARGGTEVIDELRPGYRWRGKLLRYSQVRVARP